MAYVIRLKNQNVLDNVQMKELSDQMRQSLSVVSVCEETVCSGSAMLLSFRKRVTIINVNFIYLTVLLSKEKDHTAAIVIGSGVDSIGIFWSIDRSIAEKAERFLKQKGFEPQLSD